MTCLLVNAHIHLQAILQLFVPFKAIHLIIALTIVKNAINDRSCPLKFGLVSTVYREIFAHVSSPISPPLSTGESKTGRIQFLNLFLFKQNGGGGGVYKSRRAKITRAKMTLYTVFIYTCTIQHYMYVYQGFLVAIFIYQGLG